jgi:hypothetical protein
MKKRLIALTSLASLAFIQCQPGDCLAIWNQIKDKGHHDDPSNGGGKPTDPHTGPGDTLFAYSTRDVHVDQENRNTGLGSEVRLYYADALALVAFDSLPPFPEGKKLVRAEMSVNGWTDAEGDADVTLDLFRTAGGWTEGTGHWYAHSGGFHNGYETVYSQFPEYTPPAVTTDPVVPSGVLWSTSQALRSDMQKITTGKGILPRGFPWGCYPLLKHTGRVTFDLTAFLSDKANQGLPLTLGLRQAPASAGPNEGFAWIYSRNHVDPKNYGPKLVLIFE